MEKKSCLPTCRPFHPCCIPGCPNIGDVQVGVGNGAAGRDYDKDITDNDVIAGGRGKAHMGVENDPGRIDQNKILDSDSNVDIGANNTAEGDSNMEVFRNQVGGGRPRANVRVGAANDAGQDNNMGVDCNDGDHAVDDVGNTARRDDNIEIENNYVRGASGGVRIGAGNRAGRDNCGPMGWNRLIR